jgi:hypothetical protein
MTLSRTFKAAGATIIASGAGRATGEQRIPADGRYDFFLGGSFGRPVDVSVDRQHVGTAAYQVSYPHQWLLIGSRWLSRGVHSFQIRRGGADLHPGSGDGLDHLNRTIGPLVVIPARPAVPLVSYSSVREFRRICQSSPSLRWVDVVRPT